METNLFNSLESKVMDWYDSLNNQNTRDTPQGQLRIPPFLVPNPNNQGFSLKVVNQNNPTPIDKYLLPSEYANQTLTEEQQADLYDLVYGDVVNTRRNIMGGKKRRTKQKRTKQKRTKQRKTKSKRKSKKRRTTKRKTK